MGHYIPTQKIGRYYLSGCQQAGHKQAGLTLTMHPIWSGLLYLKLIHAMCLEYTCMSMVGHYIFEAYYPTKHIISYVLLIHRDGVWEVFCELNASSTVVTTALHPANWGSRSVTLCCTYARNFVFQDDLNFYVDVERMVCFPCVWLCFICVSFEFILGPCVFTLRLRCYQSHGELKMVSNQHIMNTNTSWSDASINLLGYMFYWSCYNENLLYLFFHRNTTNSVIGAIISYTYLWNWDAVTF